jgi:hypothetical protein
MRRIFLAALAAAACQTPPETGTAGQEVSAPEHTFRFEAGTDPASLALIEAVAIEVATPTTQAEAQDLTARGAANRTDRSRRAAAIVPILIEELGGREPDDDLVFGIVLELLADTGRDDAAAYLAAWTRRPRPTGDSRLLAAQGLAVDALGRMSAGGNLAARAALLDVVEADPVHRRLAVEGYYRGRGDRFRAKRELLARIPAADRYLVHTVVPAGGAR